MDEGEGADWPLRAWALALAGAGVGIAVYLLVHTGPRTWQTTDAPWRLALAALLVVGGAAFAFTVERARQPLAAGFALVAALVVAAVVDLSGGSAGWDSGATWRLICALLTVAIAAPLFQAWRDGGGRIAYAVAHNRAWTNVVLWFAAWAFVGIVWGLAWLLSALFGLIGIDALRQLLERPWFAPLLTGFAFGGAVGLLRDRGRILGTLQRVATTVLAVLAPVLAAGLLIFLAALPLTGLAPLWGATKSTTPILIGCVIGALLLANAVIGDAPEDERGGVLRWSAMGLGVAMLPLGIIAAVSTGRRIDQYGLSPDRLWAVVFTGIACAYGLGYLAALIRRRAGWGEAVRTANLHLAFGLCGLALLLSTPLLGFGAIATRDQLARLADGRTPAAKFDWAALRFEFGPAGRAAVEKLAKAGATPGIRQAAADAMKLEGRYTAGRIVQQRRDALTLDSRLRILPRNVPLPKPLRDRLSIDWLCGADSRCALLYRPGGTEAVLVITRSGEVFTSMLAQSGEDWVDPLSAPLTPADLARREAQVKMAKAAIARGDVEVRDVLRRQVFVGGEPVGQVFDRAKPQPATPSSYP